MAPSLVRIWRHFTSQSYIKLRTTFEGSQNRAYIFGSHLKFLESLISIYAKDRLFYIGAF